MSKTPEKKGNVIYDEGVTLLDTWHALESLVDEGRCKAIGLSDVNIEKAKEIFELARIKPAVILLNLSISPGMGVAQFCRRNDIVLQAFAALGIATIRRTK